MDVFKLAFETIIVGLLTFLWLGLATYFLSPNIAKALLFADKPKVLLRRIGFAATSLTPRSGWEFLSWPTA